ncbi:MAG: hypothetical protein PHP01_09635 [Phycisphaerae bacterium]|nr:hypothetical protein [Phycisphaerae bacterium]
MEKFIIEKGEFGKKMVVLGELTEDIVEYCAGNGIVELELNWAKGFRGSLDMLEKFIGLLSLEICDYTIEDIAVIHRLKDMKHIRRLSISTYCKTPIDFGGFENLSHLSVFWRKGIIGLDRLQKLKSLFIYKYNPQGGDLSQLAQIESLEELSLKVPNIKSIGDVQMLKNLKSLGIYAATKLESIEGIKLLPNLNTLEIEGCSKINDISAIGELAGLVKLSVSNCKRIESLRPVEKLENLSELRFIESTNVIDGKVAFIKNLPRLKNVIFQNRRHYDFKREEFVR